MTAKTGRTGHAVYFIAQAIAMARLARPTQPLETQARATQISAITGGSVMPSVSGNATTGEAIAITVSRVTWPRQPAHRRNPCGAMMAKATTNSASVASDVQTRGSP